MRKFSIEDNLRKKLGKLSKKDRVLYSAAMKKMDEILSCEDVSHYKNLKSPMQDFKRVHVRGSFVLIFKYLDGKVLFFGLGYHDDVYR